MASDSGNIERILDTLAAKPLNSKNITIDRKRRTSIRLEPSMWEALEEIGRRENLDPDELCTLINQRWNRKGTRTALIRVFILAYFRAAEKQLAGEAAAAFETADKK